MIAVYLFSFASSMASSVSVSEPIWFTFTRMELPIASFNGFAQKLNVGDKEVVTDELRGRAHGLG